MMSKIFAKASQVHVWLGEQFEDGARPLRVLEQIEKKFDDLNGMGLFDPSASQHLSQFFINDGEVASFEWDALASMLSRAWVYSKISFTRSENHWLPSCSSNESG